MLVKSKSNRFRRNATHNRIGKYIVGDNRTSPDDCTITDLDSTQNQRMRANPHIVTNGNSPRNDFITILLNP